jgi:hypothetical protein
MMRRRRPKGVRRSAVAPYVCPDNGRQNRRRRLRSVAEKSYLHHKPRREDAARIAEAFEFEAGPANASEASPRWS